MSVRRHIIYLLDGFKLNNYHYSDYWWYTCDLNFLPEGEVAYPIWFQIYCCNSNDRFQITEPYSQSKGEIGMGYGKNKRWDTGYFVRINFNNLYELNNRNAVATTYPGPNDWSYSADNIYRPVIYAYDDISYNGSTYGIESPIFIDFVYESNSSDSSVNITSLNFNNVNLTPTTFSCDLSLNNGYFDWRHPFLISVSTSPQQLPTSSENKAIVVPGSLTINSGYWYVVPSTSILLTDLSPNTQYYLYVAGAIGENSKPEQLFYASSGYGGYTFTSYSFTTPNYTACTAPTITVTTSGSNITVSWSGAQAGIGNSITGYKIGYNSWDSVDEFFNSVAETLSANTTSKTYSLSAGEYYFAVKTLGSQGLDSDWAWSDKVTLTPNYTPCTAPTSVTGTGNQSSITINWSGASAGIGNPITGYEIGYNSSGSIDEDEDYMDIGSNRTVSANVTSYTYTGLASGNYYFAVRTLGTEGTASNPDSDWKWSSKITVKAKPQVTSGAPITKAQMDALKTYLGNGNTVTVGNQITAADGATYKSGPTAGTLITAAWYNS